MSALHSWQRKVKQNKKANALCIISENVLILKFITKESRIKYLEEDGLLKYERVTITHNLGIILCLSIKFYFKLPMRLERI